MNEDPIIRTVKELCGIYPDDPSFDGQLLVFINAVIATLREIGIGPQDSYMITGEETWEDYLNEYELSKLQEIKTYVGFRVRMMFDPPSNSSATEAIKETIKEMEWRMFVNIEPREGNVL